MALLASCWLIIESVLIPEGILKWFYLSFYIHPFFLFLYQIFLFLKYLNRWVLFIISFPLRIICFLSLLGVNFFRGYLSFTNFSNSQVVQQVENFHIIPKRNLCQVVGSLSYSRIEPMQSKLKVLEFSNEGFVEHNNKHEDDEDFEEGNAMSPVTEEHVSSFRSLDSSASEEGELDKFYGMRSEDKDLAIKENLSSDCSYDLVVESSELLRRQDKEEQDEFYKKYIKRMRWFDVLNYDRTCGLNAIVNKQVAATSSFESIGHADFSIPHMPWTEMARKMLLKSLESDFELVYVGQSCLSWEALHYQYTKVKNLASCSENGVFGNNVAREFQKFQVLLERFMEDERTCEGNNKRLWNYVCGRFALKSLLQVPEILDYVEEAKEETAEVVEVKQVLEAVEKCIHAFGEFLETDNKQSGWRLKSYLWASPPVEDPRDLSLLAQLFTRLQKNKRWLASLEGKKRCWIRRVVNPLEETQRKELLFTMIDVKLVSRVLQMSVLSSSQLRWCQQKLDNIEFKQGKVIRTPGGPLFPHS